MVGWSIFFQDVSLYVLGKLRLAVSSSLHGPYYGKLGLLTAW